MRQCNSTRKLCTWLSAMVLGFGLAIAQAGVQDDMKLTLIFTDGGTGTVGSIGEPVARQLFLLDPAQGAGGVDPVGVMIII